jgi:hypothetical protein
MQDFIRENRAELEAAIRGALKDPDIKLPVRELELWIRNDEGLYLWARRSGVRV